MSKTKIIFLGLVIIISFSSFSQESIIKNFAEQGGKSWLYPICLYPSTLRMVNISGDPEFNELINDVEKVLIYPLDSASLSSPNLHSWLTQYEELGYEEYIRIYGAQSIRLLGNEDEYVGMFGVSGKQTAFYLRGTIAFEKIPHLINNFQSNSMLDLLTDQFK